MAGRTVATGIFLLACAASAAQASGPGGPPPPDARPLAAQRSDGPPAITYHLHRDGKDWGPYTLDQLRTMAAEGNFFREDHVWKSGSGEWRLAADVPELSFATEFVAADEPVETGPYYVDAAGQATGPFTLDEMKAKAAAGALLAGSIVWAKGAQDWARADAVEALKPLFPATQADDGAATDDAAGDGTTPDAAPETGDGDGTVARPEGEAAGDTADAVPVPPDAAGDAPPPPPDDAPAVQYFVSIDGKAVGPFAADDIRAKITAGEIGTATFIWWKGGAWTKAGEVEAFRADFPLVPERPPFDCSGHMAGGWERRMFVQGQTLILQTIFDVSGQFSGTQAIAGYPGVNFYGSWTAEAVGEASCSLTTNTRYPQTSSATSVFEVIDGRSMRDTTDGTIVRRIR